VNSCHHVNFEPRLKTKAQFIQPMLLLRTERLPEGADWIDELKLDGYRALAVKSGGRVQLRSRNDKNFNHRYSGLVEAFGRMPDETVLDGEVVALDEEGRPSFNTLQNRAPGLPLHFFIFDLLVLRGRDVMAEPLVKPSRVDRKACPDQTAIRTPAS
jgi:bifunctional non-homologous end joining protein LigD